MALATDFLISQLNRCLLKRSIFRGSVTHCGSSPVRTFISSVYRYMYSCNVSLGLCALAIRYELRCCFVCKFEKFSCKASLQSSHDIVGEKLLMQLEHCSFRFCCSKFSARVTSESTDRSFTYISLALVSCSCMILLRAWVLSCCTWHWVSNKESSELFSIPSLAVL